MLSDDRKSLVVKAINDEFLLLLSCLRNERDHVTLMAFVKRCVSMQSSDSPQELYSQIDTPYAFSFISKQFSLMQNDKLFDLNNDQDSLVMSSSRGDILVTSVSCECTFWTSMKLPCHHILKFREAKCLPLFCIECIDTRWKVSYLKTTFENKEQLQLTK